MRVLKWTSAIVAVLALVAVLFVAFGLNTLRGPISRAVTQASGRELLIEGKLKALWDWRHPRFRAEKVSFANPEWASEEHMFRADAVELTVKVLPLFIGRVVLPEVHLERPEVFLEMTPDGKKNWLLDRDQQDPGGSRIHILALTLDEGKLKYDQPATETSVAADLSTDPNGVVFLAKGTLNGLPVVAAGRGGPVLGLRDYETPYPVKAEVKIGDTAASLEGIVTSIVELKKYDLVVQLSGKTMAEVYDIVGIALPETSPYKTSGRLIRNVDVVRYENFTGKVGASDIAGAIQVQIGGERPLMTGNLTSKLLKFADLGPLVGTTQPREGGVLPDSPFDTARWDSVDADVRIRATRIERPEQLPIEHLDTRIQMRNKLLSLDPLEFGIAGGKLVGPLRLDGRKDPIQADARMRVQKLSLAKLFPTIKENQASIGDITGLVELNGSGNSVARMLGTSQGKIGVFLDGGKVSAFLMQLAAMDLWGVAKVKLQGDKLVDIHCAIADFGVKDGVAHTNAFIFDTAVVKVTGEGTVNLNTEALDLKLTPHPKDGSIASLKSPVYIRGTFGAPKVSPDVKRIAAKGGGALVMAVLNPLLAVVPLIEEGGAKDSPCGQLLAEITSSTRSAAAGATAKPPAPQPKPRPEPQPRSRPAVQVEPVEPPER